MAVPVGHRNIVPLKLGHRNGLSVLTNRHGIPFYSPAEIDEVIPPFNHSLIFNQLTQIIFSLTGSLSGGTKRIVSISGLILLQFSLFGLVRHNGSRLIPDYSRMIKGHTIFYFFNYGLGKEYHRLVALTDIVFSLPNAKAWLLNKGDRRGEAYINFILPDVGIKAWGRKQADTLIQFGQSGILQGLSSFDVEMTCEEYYLRFRITNFSGAVSVDWNDGSELEVFEIGDHLNVTHYYEDYNTHYVTIHDAQNLYALEANGNGMTEITNLTRCKQLVWIDVSSNYLTEFETSPDWVDLTTLKVSYNTNLGSLTLHEEWTNFELLEAANCGLTELTLFESWEYFYGINASYNSLTELEVYESWNMVIVDVSNNNLGTFNTYASWTNLLQLNVQNCGLTSLDTFEEWTAIQELMVGGNQLHSIDTYASWTALAMLGAENCHLESITLFAEWTGLIWLWLQENQLTSITTYDWSSLQDFTVNNNTGLTAIDLKAAWVDIRNINVGSTGVTALDYRTAWTIAYQIYFNASYCALTETEVNDILINADTQGCQYGHLFLNGGTNAAPTGAGITAKNNLKNVKHWDVYTN